MKQVFAMSIHPSLAFTWFSSSLVSGGHVSRLSSLAGISLGFSASWYEDQEENDLITFQLYLYLDRSDHLEEFLPDDLPVFVLVSEVEHVLNVSLGDMFWQLRHHLPVRMTWFSQERNCPHLKSVKLKNFSSFLYFLARYLTGWGSVPHIIWK